jgi:hypothetical protein
MIETKGNVKRVFSICKDRTPAGYSSDDIKEDLGIPVGRLENKHSDWSIYELKPHDREYLSKFELKDHSYRVISHTGHAGFVSLNLKAGTCAFFKPAQVWDKFYKYTRVDVYTYA